MRRLLPALAAAALWTGGCGHVGDPLAPRANIPGKITDLAAVQRGSNLYARFSVPQRTTEGIAITTPLALELRAGPGMDPFDIQKWAAQSQQFKPASVQNGVADYEIPAGQWAGKEILLSARATGINRKDSGWSSPPLIVNVVAPPAVPQNLNADAAPEGVRLTWTAAPGDFRIYRQGPGEKAFSRVADVAQTSWTDTTAEFGKPYVYLVQRIIKLAGREAESEKSNVASITPKDTFPPATPTGLHASVAPGSIELAWQQNAESDLAGYRVYRAVGNGPFERVAEVSQIPAYSDHAVEAGKTYRYAVSAFDQSNNESGRSAPFEVGMP